ncbi:Crossover junction endodeoxyribonuclease RuvC [bacterium HR34]|nr:Crossover junction endodeoxyribonuclease RuvC [bacterium HR34]
MVILGIDPGVERTGYGVIKVSKKTLKCVDYGCIFTDKSLNIPQRILELSKSLSKIIKKYKPKVAGVENIFFFKNLKTAVKVSEARGAILLTLAKNNIEMLEFTPLQVKMALIGYGRADKGQIQKMVKEILKLKEIPKPDDAADAMAVAICAVRQLKLV